MFDCGWMRRIFVDHRLRTVAMGLVCLVMAALLGIASPPARAFVPTNGGEYVFGVGGLTHQDITEQAITGLYQEFFGTTRQTAAMKKALKQIVDANAAVDGDQRSSEKHFDSENFAGGQAWIDRNAAGILSNLNEKNAAGARFALGQALHTVQDFYSHSNWIERGNSAPNEAVGRYGATVGPVSDFTYCNDCVPGVGCYDNIVGMGLTSGYYGGNNKPDPSSVKCRHGGPWDSGSGPLGGINKDTNVFAVSPHWWLHGAAATAAFGHTQAFIREVKGRISSEQLKLLFGVGPTLAMAVDTTGSMSEAIEGVIGDAIAIVNSKLDTDDEPLKYVLSQFNDPSVGPVTVTDDPDAFKAALGSLSAEDGGDCPEYSMYGLLNAVAASDEDANVFLFTDASSKDGEIAGAVSTLAEQKHIKVYEGLSGSCSPIDPAYLAIAKRTGGQLFFMSRSEAGQLSELMDAVVGSDVAEMLAVSETLAGTKQYSVPVDSTLTRMTFSISLVQLDASMGAPPVVIITRPDGTVVTSTDPGIRITALSTSAVYTITSPQPGIWNVSVSGTGALSLKAMGNSSLQFDRFDFVRSDEHAGLVPIPGLPAAGQSTMAAATISGDFATVQLELRTEGAAPLLDLALAPESGGAPGKLYGQVTVPTSSFVVYATGTDSNGFSFQRVLPRSIAPQTVEVLPPAAMPLLTAGEVATYVFTVSNSGPNDTFRFTTLDSRGFGTSVSASTITLASGATADVTVTVTVPGDAAHGTLDNLVATVESATGIGAHNSAVAANAVTRPMDFLVVAPSVRNITATDLILEWTAPIFDVTSYSVERGTTSTGPWDPVTSGVVGRSIADTGLTPNTAYYYRLGAVNADGVTIWSSARGVTTSPPAPGTPTFGPIHSHFIETDWTAAAGATIYKLERAPDVSGAPGAWAQASTATHYLWQWDIGLDANTIYWYRVRAWNGVSDGPYSGQDSAMTAPNAPGVPTFSNVLPATVTVNWAAPTGGAASYKVERATTASGPWTEVANGVTTLSFADVTVAANSTYWYQVRATNARGLDGYYSDAASVTTPVDPSVSVPAATGTPTYTYVSTSYLSVNWSAATGSSSYKVERAPDASGAPDTWTQIASGVTALTYVDSGLTANTQYWYRVRATNAGGDGPYSSASRIVTLPNAPGPVTFSNLGPYTATVNWTASTGGAASYKLERAPDASGAPGVWTQIAGGVESPTYIDATVVPSTSYWYRVRATNAVGLDGSYSSTASVTTPVDPGTPVPGAPATPTYTSVSTSYLIVNWTAATGAASYKVERAPDASGAPGTWTQIAGGVTTLTYFDTSLTANIAYWYRVRATNAGGDGAYSAASSVMTLPNAPGTPTFSNVASNTVTASWTAPTGGAASYRVERGTGAYGPWTQVATGVTALSFADATVAANMTYWYRVGANSQTGASYSSSASVSTPADPGTPVPGAPATPTYTSVSTSYLIVNWTAATGAVSYKVERAPDASGAPGTWTQIAGGVTTLTYFDTSLTANIAYWYRVRATNAGGDGAYSAASSVTTLPNAPGTPTFSNVASNTVTASWTAPTGGAASYRVDRGTGAYGPWTQVATGVTALSYADATVAANMTYWYRVGANSQTGASYSSSASVSTPADPGTPVPGAPGTPTYGSVSTSYLYVNWTAATGAASYKIERAPDASGAPGTWTQIAAGMTALNYFDSALTANIAYWYRVRGTNAGGDGAYSAASSVTTLPNAPGTPTFSNVASNTVTASWTAPTGGAASYRVERGTGAYGPWTQVATGVTALNYADTTVTANMTYWYRVGANNQTGASYSSSASVTTPVDPGTPVPGAPGSPTYTSVSTSYLYVNWTAATGAASYKVERAPAVSGAPGAWTQIAGGVTALTYFDTALTANTAYWYRVRATNAGGDGAYSAASSVMTLTNAPGTPTFSNVASNTVTVNWTAPTGGAASYKVERATSSSGPWTQVASGVTALSYSDSTVAANSAYWYRVRATNTLGLDGSYTSAASVSTPPG